MSKHTPGPWKLRRAEHSLEHDFILHAGPHIIAWSVPRADRSNTRKKSEHIANAKLIAAAPELLEALVGMLAIVDDSQAVAGYHLNGELEPWDGFPEIERARAAIAKCQ